MLSQSEATLALERLGKIGGSDCSSIWNIDYGCKRKLAYRLSGTTPDFPEVSRPEFERGKYLEPVAAKLYADKSKRPVRLADRRVHPAYPWMVVHMDRIITAPDRGGEGYLEIKVVNHRAFNQFLKEGIKEQYILQMQHGLAVTGYSWGSYAILCADPWRFEWADVERDEELISKIVAEEQRFINDLENKTEFERLEPTDKRCQTCIYRYTCQGAGMATILPPGERDADLLDRTDLLPLAAEIHELQTMKADLESMIAEASENMMAQIPQDAVGVRYPGGRTYRIQSKGSRKWDSNALWALWEKATPRLKEMLGPYCNNGREGRPPKPFLKHYWTSDKNGAK